MPVVANPEAIMAVVPVIPIVPAIVVAPVLIGIHLTVAAIIHRGELRVTPRQTRRSYKKGKDARQLAETSKCGARDLCHGEPSLLCRDQFPYLYLRRKSFLQSSPRRFASISSSAQPLHPAGK
jgi:hypothetical protein